MALATGKKAPLFSLKDKDGNVHNLSDFKTNYTAVYFYPKDNTPGCSIEAVMFSKDLEKYKKTGTTVIGISGGDEKSKTKFCDKLKLKILLLSDPDFAVCKKYGVYGEKSFMGRKFMGINRITFLLDKNKKIIHVWEKAKPPVHSKEVLEHIKSLK